MSSEAEDKVLFKMYHINGYDGSVGTPNATIDSIDSAPVDNIRPTSMGDDVTLN